MHLIYNIGMKIGIIVDSSCGLTKKQANERGWGFLPLIMNINGKDIQDGIEIDSKTFYSKLKINDDVRTSATPPAIIIDEFEKFSKENDLVIAYGISTELSSQTNNMKTFAKDFPNVHVVDSKGVSQMIINDIQDTLEIATKGISKEEIIKTVEGFSKRQYGIAIPETLKWLVKGGRVNPSVAQMANLLKIIPIIKFEDGKLEKHGVGRIFKKSVVNSAVEVMRYTENGITVIHGEQKNIDELKMSIEKEIGQEVQVTYFPPVVALHTGPGVVAIIGRKK